MIRTTCEYCDAELRRAGLGRPQRFCSGRCRVAAHRKKRAGEAVPAEIRGQKRWIRHGADKTPLRADTGRAASSTDPRTWTDHGTAARSPHGAGLGFVLNGDGIVCVDLDHCLTADGQLAPWAAAILNACPPTYTEVSPSGTGLHLWGHGHVVRGRRIRREDGAHIEVYGTGRYIALGRRYGQAPAELADISEVITSLTT
ncbi:bifunctional DNA primase/polymerase [Streptomyces corynorhini]|uniref:DNA primase n=1 Tax=Streptomyces corynorhini TaxID=2282652 RepID=A0A370B823_9ACTN|nr:bifunctional DNA primase/polymerase [Streptomyces corynorhini]RDG37950.1 DNA primase [Streptomyces corynorhini]